MVLGMVFLGLVTLPCRAWSSRAELQIQGTQISLAGREQVIFQDLGVTPKIG